MRLKAIKYSEFDGSAQVWILEELTLGTVNLLVGKNATGKSRTLNIISSLATLLAGTTKPGLSGKYEATFDHDGQVFRYSLNFKDQQVVKEQVRIGDVLRLDRGEGGEGSIYAEKVDGGSMIPFQTPQNEAAAVARQDSIQHPYLGPLSEWGQSVRHLRFGTHFGQGSLMMLVEKGNYPLDVTGSDAPPVIFHKSFKKYAEPFKQQIIHDMGRIGYPLDDIAIKLPFSIRLQDVLPGELRCLTVKEKGLNGHTDQHSMSQGMYRALSVLILIAYFQHAEKAACLLIDDIGEGLDFDRSCRLIEVLRERASEIKAQLILSTNDRFVMNGVPLEEWSVLQREGSLVRALNVMNSPALFEDFKFTGLSNFSFLELDFAAESPKEEVANRE